MDNFKLHEEATRLANRHSAYMLAKMLLIEQKERIELAAHVERITQYKKRLEAKQLMPARLAGIIEEAPASSLARVKDKAQADFIDGLFKNHTEFAHPEAGHIVELLVRLEAGLRQQANQLEKDQ